MSSQDISKTAGATALRRKLAAGGEEGAQPSRSLLRALRLSLARSAKEQMELVLSVIDAKQASHAVDGLAEILEEDRLHILLDGPDGERGGISLDRACVSAVIQQQTVGKVLGPPPADRPFTATDAAMSAHLIDEMLSRASETVDNPQEAACIDGYRFGARAADRCSLLLALEATQFQVIELIVDINGGAGKGSITVLVPDTEVVIEDEAVQIAPGLEQSFPVVRAELTAVIARLQLPLSQLNEMQVGHLLPLVQERLDQIELVTIGGQLVTVGRLGQIGGLRALRVNETRVPRAESQQEASFSETALLSAQEDDPDTDVIDAEALSGSSILPDSEVTKIASASAVEARPINHSDTGPEDSLLELGQDEAVAEIAQLAGLPPPDPSRNDLPDVINSGSET
ncbi:FliM/FliN family flagellar motor C-terminal domain-containing protein [Primorskyibacter sp. S87]|uniref:FliM/FliN family flagellar motor C-terminal domain-containing protein n=1 Tax=Primorskyibacter sp. S87 TaxID=3415126 RepID=UPI003C7E0B03